MQKLASKSAKELYLKDREDSAFDALKASADPYSGAKAFSKGFGVSFALPLALGLSSLKPQQIASQMAQTANTYIISEQMKKGLMEGGISSKEANRMAPYLTRRFQANQGLPIPMSASDPSRFSALDIEVRRAARNNIKKDILNGTGVFLNKTHKWTGPPQVASLPLNRQGYKALEQAAGKQLANQVLEATADDIYKSMTFKAPKETALARLVEVGEKALIRDGKDIIPAARAKSRKIMLNILKGPAKLGLGLGVLGGISNVISNMKTKKRYMEYKKRAGALK